MRSAADDERPLAGGEGDPLGLLCPLAAHIRKVNPREAPNDLGASRAAWIAECSAAVCLTVIP